MKASFLLLCTSIALVFGARVPKIFVKGVTSDSLDSRQVVLNKLLDTVTATVEGKKFEEDFLDVTTQSLYDVYQRYQLGILRSINPDVEVFSAVLEYAGTDAGKRMFKKLKSTDTHFRQAEVQLSKNRDRECRQLTLLKTFSDAATSCMCDPHEIYSYCRMLVAHEANQMSQSSVTSTASDPKIDQQKDHSVADIQHFELDIENNTMAASVNRSESKTTSKLLPFFDRETGTYMTNACIGQGIQLCVRRGAVGPTTEMLISGGRYIIEHCTQTGKLNCTNFDPLALIQTSSADKLMNMRLELDVSLCLGITGMQKLLRRFGLGSCYDLLSLKAYVLDETI
jgi:hypothetical protein